MVSRLVLGLAAFGPLLVLCLFGPPIDRWRRRRIRRLIWQELERDLEISRSGR